MESQPILQKMSFQSLLEKKDIHHPRPAALPLGGHPNLSPVGPNGDELLTVTSNSSPGSCDRVPSKMEDPVTPDDPSKCFKKTKH